MSVKLNDINVVQGRFPNNEIDYTPSQRFLFSMGNPFECPNWDEFTLVFESNEDLFNLMLIKKWWDDHNRQHARNRSCLIIKFFPYGQMDREMKDHLFSLKYVAQIINDMNFDEVVIFDPHSNVLAALINNVNIEYPIRKHLNGLAHLEELDYDFVFYPDNGAAKKYSEIINLPYRFGNKKRNLKTGEIECYEVIADGDEIRGTKILMVDDLVMGGRTFIEAAKVLREKGAKKIDLYVTHLMPQARNFYNTKGNGLFDNIESEDTLKLIPIFETPEPRP